MSKTYRVHDASRGGELLGFFCPGCVLPHQIHISGSGPVWSFDGNNESPTCAPSILVTGHQGDAKERRCHSFLRQGRLQFLGDCTHALAGQTVDLPELPEWLA